MSRTDTLRASRDDKAVKFMEFMRLHAKNPRQIVCFFEGDDAKYFCFRIESNLGGGAWTPVNCRGKRMVLDLHDLLKEHLFYKAAPTAFFVDRDFDPPLSPATRATVYETSCYSIENMYTSEASFRRVLMSEFGLNDGVEDGSPLEKCCELYCSIQKQFHDAMCDVNAWIWLQKNIGGQAGNKLNLKDVRLDRFVAVGLKAVSTVYSLSEMAEIFPLAATIAQDVLQKKCADFQNLSAEEKRLTFRGKYEIEFLRLFVGKLIEDFRKESPEHFPRRGSVKINLSRDNIISELCQYADTPEDLPSYLTGLKTRFGLS